VTGYLLRSGSAAIGTHGIPENAACFPNWVRRDLEKGGVVGFERLAIQEGNVPAHWKGTTTTVLNGTIVRVHEITNTGKPILDATVPDVPVHRSYVLQHTRMMTRQRQRRPVSGEQQNVVVLRGDDAIRVVRYSGPSVRPGPGAVVSSGLASGESEKNIG
jgi:hypothetical protein